ncbi:MAG: WD40/YVTN/BNR-like repeat-containing protein [Fimbriiglobus sp.]
MLSWRTGFFVLTFCITLTSVSSAQDAGKPKDDPTAKYRLVGPYAGGRVCRACGIPGDPTTYYAATASGGLWKSVDGGYNWKPIFDDQPTSSVGSIAVAPSDANVVYVGTGEANIRGNVTPGAGIFKSEDAGKTWKHVWKAVGQIGTMAVHPTNPDVAYAAVLGHAFGPNAERGIYRTKNGGKTWDRVLFKNDDTGASDVVIDPNNPRVVLAGLWQTRRRPWEMTSGGPGSDLYISHDGGDTWKSLKPDAKKLGLPEGVWGKVGVAISPVNSARMFAIIEADKGGLFRSDDAGASWSLVNESRPIRQRAWYYHTLTPHPTNENILFAPQVNFLKSIDGGRSFSTQRGLFHGDNHDVWLDPKNPARQIVANDGGINITVDGGKTWFAPPLPITQFYHVHADNSVPYNVMGNMQDLGTSRGPSRSLAGAGISLGEWHTVGGGETGFTVSDPTDPNIIYSGEYGGILTRYDHKTRMSRNISVNQTNPSGIDPAKHKYRFQWTSPLMISKHDPKTVYHAGNVIFRTTDGGQSWTPVSPDLSRNDKQKQQWSGGPITGDNTGAETYCTVFALAESPKQKGVLWAGTDDGKVHLTIDDGKTWTDLTANIPEIPDWGTVECLEPSPHDVKTCYLVVDNHRMDDYRPHVWKTTDQGKTWKKISDTLPQDVFCNVVREDAKKVGLLYLGTERGIMLSRNSGDTWKSLQLNLPTVPVTDLQVKDDDLVVGTQGRSFWILDDLTTIREQDAKLAEKPAHLYTIRPTVKWASNNGSMRIAGLRTTTANPAYGAVVMYQLNDKVTGDVKLEILDSKGKVIVVAKGKAGEAVKDDEEDEDDDAPPSKKERKLSAKAGPNRFEWDLTHDGAEVIPGAVVDAGNPGQGIPASPGEYKVKLTAGGQTVEQPLTLKPDPRLMTPPSVEQEAFGLKVRDQLTKLATTVLRLRMMQKQLGLRKDLFKDNDAMKDFLKNSEALGKKLSTLEEKLHNPKAKITYDVFSARGGAMLLSQFTWLLANAADGEGPPTKAMLELEAELTKTLDGYLAEYEKLMAEDVKTLNDTAKKLGAPELYVVPAKK